MENQFLLGMLLGAGAGIAVALLYIVYRIRQVIKTLDSAVYNMLEEVESNLVGVVVEKHEDMYRLYRESDKQFICQGTTLQEIRSAFKELYPTKTCYIASGDDAIVEELKLELSKESVK